MPAAEQQQREQQSLLATPERDLAMRPRAARGPSMRISSTGSDCISPIEGCLGNVIKQNASDLQALAVSVAAPTEGSA